MTDIQNIINAENNIKVDVELESDEDMPDLVEDSDNDMPDLVEDSDSDSDMPELVDSNTENEWTPNSTNDDLMVAVFKRPSCPRCEAALKILLAHKDNNDEDVTPSEQDNVSEDSDETAADDESSNNESDSDSDYVPSETESDSSEYTAPRRIYNTSTSFVVPPIIRLLFILFIALHIVKFLSKDTIRYTRC